MQPNSHKFLTSTMLGIYAVSFIIQSLLFLNWDVASLLHATQVLLHGGNYAREIFTPNPPMILYLYMPPVLFSALTTINLTLVFPIYVYLLCTLSLILCNHFLKTCFDGKPNQINLFIISMAVGFLVLPTYEFGNRDHLLSVLSMPYLLLTASRLNGKAAGTALAVVIGAFAGAAFAIKPYFLITPALIECYFIFRRRSLFAWLKPEVLAMTTVVITYDILLFTLHSEYVHTIIPFLLRVYYPTVSAPFKSLLIYPLTVFCYMSILLYLVAPDTRNRNPVYPIMFIALIGFMASLFIQRTLFYYHFLPALTIAFMFTVLFVHSLLSASTSSKKLFLLAMIFVATNIYLFSTAWHYIIFYPYVFYTFFGVLFTGLLFYLARQISTASIIIRAALVLTAGIFSAQLILSTTLYSHQFLIAIITMLALFAILSLPTKHSLTRNLLSALILISLFYVPAMEEYVLFLGPRQYKVGPLENMTAFIKQRHGNPSIYAFSPSIYYTYPLIYYSSARSAQRFEQLWPVVGFSKNIISEQDKTFLLDMIADDLRTNKPDLVLIDPRDWENKKINYLNLFTANASFRKEWQHYQYLTTVHIGKMNNTDISMPVYERI